MQSQNCILAWVFHGSLLRSTRGESYNHRFRHRVGACERIITMEAEGRVEADIRTEPHRGVYTEHMVQERVASSDCVQWLRIQPGPHVSGLGFFERLGEAVGRKPDVFGGLPEKSSSDLLVTAPWRRRHPAVLMPEDEMASVRANLSPRLFSVSMTFRTFAGLRGKRFPR